MIEIFYTKIIKLKARNCRVSIFFRSFQDKEDNLFNIKTEFGSEVVDLGRFEAWVGLNVLGE